MGFLSTADDKDKANVPWLLLAGVVFGAALIGILLTLLEHTNPLASWSCRPSGSRRGVMDGLQVARFRGAYRLAAQNLNQGMERVDREGRRGHAQAGGPRVDPRARARAARR